MVDLRYEPITNSPSRGTADGTGFRNVRGTRDGAIFVADWRQALVMEGRGYHITVGALTTGITGGGAGTVIDAEQPEFSIAVPDGTCILPLRILVECQVGQIVADADEAEILLAVDRLTAVTGGTSTAETIFNLRTDNPRSSNCTAQSAYTADITTPVLGLELARKQIAAELAGTAANALWTDLSLLYEPLVLPILMGPCTLYGYWAGTAALTGYAQVSWLELPETAFA